MSDGLRHAVNGFFDLFGSKPAAASQVSRAARVKVESRYNEDDDESLLESATSLPRQTLKALEKQLRADGFKGAAVSGWSQGDHGGFTVHYGGEKYEFEISENVNPRPVGELGRLVKESGRYESNPMLKESDKRVIRSFVNERPASSNLLETDGVRLDKIGLGGETVAKWVGGRIAIVSTESVKSDESIIRLITSAAGPGVVDFSYARKGHRVHSHGAMGHNGQGNGRMDPRTGARVPSPRFAAGDRVVRDDGSARGEVAIVGNYDEFIGGYRYKVQQDDGGRIWWNESSTRHEGHSPNGRATEVDADAARELDLYIANTYELVGAPNSIGKSIDANLKRKLANGTYDPALAPKAWQHLVDQGAKRYEREFGSSSPIFNAATRRQVARDFSFAWEEENGILEASRPR